ncbi:MAG: peroxisome- protein [Trizodia sp. TS-e1964]|nr:MAG: peroxisome- protein [Trizodia sp. TS-e1964]
MASAASSQKPSFMGHADAVNFPPDTPWLDSMSSSSQAVGEDGPSGATIHESNAPTVASFSPATITHSPSAKQRSSILVQKKSPLLVATPPQITRALAYSHPFLLPLNKLAGLLTWTSGDPWASFLLLSAFWGAVLYGDVVMRWFGPVVVVVALMVGMYYRRYSPLSSAGWTADSAKASHKRNDSNESVTRHQKSLDEIVQTLDIFTSRCNVLLDPLLRLTDFLSTQRTATSATTRPALTTLLIRILLLTPVWLILTLPPFRIITTKRVILITGTIFLSWHSRPAHVTRAVLWRSKTVRWFCSTITGLELVKRDKAPTLPTPSQKPPLPPLPLRGNPTADNVSATLRARRRPGSPGVRFTFIVYENQRRWLGLGWTSSLFAYERGQWTDEYLNMAPSKEDFQLPDVEGGGARWRWVEGSEWRIEGEEENNKISKGNRKSSTGGGWIYYDNKWNDGKRGQDGWGRYTRRRKWYRDAELVEVAPGSDLTPPSSSAKSTANQDTSLSEADAASSITSTGTPESPASSEVFQAGDDNNPGNSIRKKRRLRSGSRTSVGRGSSRSFEVGTPRNEEDHTPISRIEESGWGVSDDAVMESQPHTLTMSSTNQGRQSPDPEHQSGDQQAAPSDGKVAGDSGHQSATVNLESNPKGPLEDAAEAKTSNTEARGVGV